MDIFIQAIGVVGILASICSFQCKSHKGILFFRTLNEFFFGIQYFLLGAYTGMAMNIVGCVRNTIFAHQIERGKKTTVSSAVFCILFFASGLWFWQGAKSLLIIIAKVLSTVAYGNKNTTVVRSLIFVTATSWLIYNICVFSVAGAVNEAFTLVSLCVGLVRFDIIPALTRRREKASA